MKNIETILQYVENEGISLSKFEREAGFGASYITKTRDRGADITSKVLDKFQEHNPELFRKVFGTEKKSFIEQRRNKKLSSERQSEVSIEGVPIYDVPIDASFLERYRDEEFHPLYYLNIPRLRNCNFGAVVSGSSMYPIMKSGSIAMCRIVENLNYIDPGEMYLISTVNGFETVKYVQPGEKDDELKLIPHNEKIKPTIIQKNMIVRLCIVEAWINFR